MLARSLTDREEDETHEDGAADAGHDVAYTFEGFDVEFSAKVMLTPAAPKPGTGEKKHGGY